MIYSIIKSRLGIKGILLDIKTARSLHSWNKKWPASPVSIDLFPTRKCNQSCLYCYDYINHLNKTEAKDNLGDDDFHKIADKGLKAGVKFWYISGGGESMIRRDLVSTLVNKIKSNGWNIGYMGTNLTLFRESDIESFITSAWDYLEVKINSSSPEIHDEIIGVKGAFKRLKRNLELFRDFKKKFRSTLPQIRLGIFLHNKNCNEFRDIVQLGISLGVDRIDIYTLLLHHSESQRLALNVEQDKKLRLEINKTMGFVNSKGVGHNFQTFVTNNIPFTINRVCVEDGVDSYLNGYLHARVCLKPWANISISANGEYGPCCVVKFKDKITNGDLEKAWYGKFFSDFREKMLDKGPLNTDTCKNCVRGLKEHNQRLIRSYQMWSMLLLKPFSTFLGRKIH